VTVLSSLFGRPSRSIESEPLTSENLAAWFSGGRRAAGVAVTEQRVLGLPAYYRALAVTAGTLAMLPLHTYRRGTRDPFVVPTVLARPNPRQTQIEWRTTCYLHGIAWGASFNRKLRNGAGQVVQVWPLHPGRCRTVETDLTGDNPEGLLFLVRDNKGVEHRYTSRDVLHIPYLSMDGISGIRPLEVFRQSLGISIATDDSAASFFANGSRLSGVLTTEGELSKTGADRLKARWRALTSGPDRTGDVAVLDSGASFTPVAIPPVDAQLLESRKWSVSDIARMVGLPPHLVGDITNSTSWGTGIEEQVLGWVKFTLGNWIELHEQRYDLELLPEIAYCKHKLEGLLRGDAKTRAAFYHSAITDGWMTRNEVRDLEDREPADGLDEYIVPSNMTLISVDGELVPLSAAGNAGDA
jgi:HK97 family phage portal protein